MPDEPENTPPTFTPRRDQPYSQSAPSQSASDQSVPSQETPQSPELASSSDQPTFEVEPSTSTIAASADPQQPPTNSEYSEAPEPVSSVNPPMSNPSTGYDTVQDENASVGTPSSPKKSKKLLIGGIIAAGLVVLIGGGAAAYNVWYQNPDKVVGDSLGNALSSKTATTDTHMKVTTSGTDASTYDLSIKTLSNLKDARADVSISGKGSDNTINMSGSLQTKDGKKVYIKINKLKDLLQESGLSVYLGSSAAATNLINKLDSKWVVIDSQDIDESTGAKKNTSQCVEETIAKLRTEKAYSKEMKTLYQKYPLIGVKNRLASKDGNLGYEVKFERENAIKFADGVNSTKFFADLQKCDGNIEKLDGQKMFKRDDSDSKTDSKVVLWINRWSHQLAKVEVTGTSDKSDVSITMSTEFNSPVVITEPTHAITVDELKKDVEALQQEMMQAYEASSASTEQSSSAGSKI